MTLQKRQFFRADFERSIGAQHAYQSFVQTLEGDYLLEFEIHAYPADELQHFARFLQTVPSNVANP